MDGRTQLPANEYLREKYHVDYVDTITEAGPVRILAEDQYSFSAESIRKRIDISINKHKSKTIALVAHYECAGNPVDKARQLEQLKTAVKRLKEKYPGIEITGLWIDSVWKVEQVKIES